MHQVFRQTLAIWLHSLPRHLPVEPMVANARNTHIPMPCLYYLGLCPTFVLTMYLLLIIPLPTSTSYRCKQALALPLLIGAAVIPIVYTSVSTPSLNTAMVFIHQLYLLRFTDLYFISPLWTGKGIPKLTMSEAYRDCMRPFRRFSQTSNRTQPQAEEQKKDLERTKCSVLAKEQNSKHWTSFLPRYFGFFIMLDLTAFAVSFSKAEYMLNQVWWSIPVLATRALTLLKIHYSVSVFTYTVMFGWAIGTGQMIRADDWTLTKHPFFPFFASNLFQFWNDWHHFFRHTWISISLKPTVAFLQRIQKQHSTILSHRRWKTIEQIIPPMVVFAVSGLMHEYTVVALWHGQVGPTLRFFVVQGLAVIFTVILLQTKNPLVKNVPKWIQVLWTTVFVSVSLSSFMQVIFENRYQNLWAEQSMLVRIYNHWMMKAT